MTDNASNALSDETGAPADAPLFRALLMPHRSLGRRGFHTLMLFVGAVSLATGIGFLLKGAWPVVGFFGLDVLLVFLAFKASYRAALAREEVSVSRTDLCVRKTSPKGTVLESHYNPFWARFHVARHTEIGITRMAVSGQGRSTEIGGFLNPDDRESFADAFGRALSQARRG
ncbi:membrane protein [Aureimonas sp. SA4125]|uniref:DUF2244 domain-containing protein n=1 Tax=Aureimonas sp. SA4125 TaxID=2826993 RepID=UPI001CC6FF11|nr:DUF2244 domain-containing protein [Aureimonas sp. SA4125]BDA82519.1 membrane protein [Aureimonas sp. SA4125]